MASTFFFILSRQITKMFSNPSGFICEGNWSIARLHWRNECCMLFTMSLTNDTTVYSRSQFSNAAFSNLVYSSLTQCLSTQRNSVLTWRIIQLGCTTNQFRQIRSYDGTVSWLLKWVEGYEWKLYWIISIVQILLSTTL